ncbi:IcmF-like protein [Escherichia coli]|nr:type VI secretion IcmF C-terminal domain-containing protein [Escherichia coli]SQQ42807.1 IcmF-like protein [Escherichia coli]
MAGEIKADLRTVSHIVTRAIRQLKQLRVDLPGWRKVLEGKRFLYELPWFMVIGSPGDGKTTALLNTGFLNEIASRTTQLDSDVKAYTGKPAMQPVPALLNQARALSAWPGLDPDSPPLAWRYGLYSVPPVMESVAFLYDRLPGTVRQTAVGVCRSRISGRRLGDGPGKRAKKTTDIVMSQLPGQELPVTREVRRLYLAEYARRWQDFLVSIHSINSAGEDGSPGLAYDLQVLRTLASPDSPLMRLSKAVVEQTTLVPPLDAQARQKQMPQRAQDRLTGNAGKAVQTAKLLQDIHPEERLEKSLVDDRFAALREVVSGRTDSGQGGGAPELNSLLTMLNEYYTQLTIADSALAASTLPGRISAADKLQLEAAKLPAPLKNILLDLTQQGTRKINAGTGEVLNAQMEAVIGDECRDAIDGRYPFTDSPQEVSADDFNRIFASGGVLDAFWTKQLAPLADTASNPWRYKPTEGNMTLLGPDLTPFQEAKQIRSVFFNGDGGKKFSWAMQVRVVDMDPAITELVIDIDGQVLRYAHGPVRPLKVNWPGPRNGSMAEITASPRIRQDTSTLLTNGPWALFHLLDAGNAQETAVRGTQQVEYSFDGRRVVLEITAGRDFDPVNRGLLQRFACPERAL